jgi:hypothetical protein
MRSDTAPKTLTTKQAEQAKAIEYLKESLKSGDTVYIILRQVSASGMSRCLDLYKIKDNQPLRLTWNAAKALGVTYDRRKEALRVGGCGMDMGFNTVYNLAWKLFGDGYALKHQWM